MKYVHYAKDTNEILGFYDPDIHSSNIPEPYVKITDDEWNKILESGCNKIDIKKRKGYREKIINIDKLKIRYMYRLKKIAKDAIINNFRSNALGSFYYYQNEQHDQLNYITAAHSGMDTYIKCSKDKTNWGIIKHSPKELKQLLIDNNIHKENILTTLEEYKSKINSSNDKETLNKLLEKFKSIVDTL